MLKFTAEAKGRSCVLRGVVCDVDAMASPEKSRVWKARRGGGAEIPDGKYS